MNIEISVRNLGVSNKVDLIQINRWKVGLGLLALFLLVCFQYTAKIKTTEEFLSYCSCPLSSRYRLC